NGRIRAELVGLVLRLSDDARWYGMRVDGEGGGAGYSVARRVARCDRDFVRTHAEERADGRRLGERDADAAIIGSSDRGGEVWDSSLAVRVGRCAAVGGARGDHGRRDVDHRD